jgi:hypothetical protein
LFRYVGVAEFVSLCGGGRVVSLYADDRVVSVCEMTNYFSTAAGRFGSVGSHPSAQDALGWGTSRFGCGERKHTPQDGRSAKSRFLASLGMTMFW